MFLKFTFSFLLFYVISLNSLYASTLFDNKHSFLQVLDNKLPKLAWKTFEVKAGIIFGIGTNGISLGATTNLYKNFTSNVAGFVGLDIVGNPYSFRKNLHYTNNGIKINVKTRNKMDLLFRFGTRFNLHHDIDISPYIILGTGLGTIKQDKYDITDKYEANCITTIDKKMLLSEYDKTTIHKYYKNDVSDPNKTPSIQNNEEVIKSLKAKGVNFINDYQDVTRQTFATSIPQLDRTYISVGKWKSVGSYDVFSELHNASIQGFEYVTSNYPYNSYDTTSAIGKNAVRTVEAIIADEHGKHHIYEISEVASRYNYGENDEIRDDVGYYLIRKDGKLIESSYHMDEQTGILTENKIDPSVRIEKDNENKVINYIIQKELNSNNSSELYIRDNKVYSLKTAFELSELYDDNPSLLFTTYNSNGSIEGDKDLKVIAINFTENNEDKSKYLIFKNTADEDIKEQIGYYNHVLDNRTVLNDEEQIDNVVDKNKEEEISRSDAVIDTDSAMITTIDTKKYINAKQKFFFKGGIGLELTFKNRFFFRLEYKYANLSATNMITYHRTKSLQDVIETYRYDYNIVNNTIREEYYENSYSTGTGIVMMNTIDNSSQAITTSGDYNYASGIVSTTIDDAMTKNYSGGQSNEIVDGRRLISVDFGDTTEKEEVFNVSKSSKFHMHEISFGFGFYFL